MDWSDTDLNSFPSSKRVLHQNWAYNNTKETTHKVELKKEGKQKEVTNLGEEMETKILEKRVDQTTSVRGMVTTEH